MKAHVSISGTATPWSGALPSSFDGWFVDIVDDPKPEPNSAKVVEEAGLVVDWTDGEPTQVRRTWAERNKTDSEAQKVASQLTLWKRLSAPERRALWNLADTEGPAGDAALLVLGAMWAAVETESRNPETKQLLGAAIQLGIVADVARARVILDDPGFSLE